MKKREKLEALDALAEEFGQFRGTEPDIFYQFWCQVMDILGSHDCSAGRTRAHAAWLDRERVR